MVTGVYKKTVDGAFFKRKGKAVMLALNLPLWKTKLASRKFSEEVKMRKKGLINTIVVMMLLLTVFGTMAMSLRAAVEQKEDPEVNCFAQFEKCTQNARTKFPGSTIDYLDCELALLRCIRLAVIG